jgi:hypothetical protein
MTMHVKELIGQLEHLLSIYGGDPPLYVRTKGSRATVDILGISTKVVGARYMTLDVEAKEVEDEKD